VAIASPHADAIHLQNVESVLDLPEGFVDVRHLQHGKHAKATRIIGDQFPGVFVGFASDSRRTRRRKLTCDVVGDTMEVAVPALSISSSER
jgi:hypothetical protein